MNIPLSAVIMFLLSIIAQVGAISLLPLTKGFTNVGYTAACAVIFVIGIGLLARIAETGVQLSTLIPLSAAAVPLMIVAVGAIFYSEPLSFFKIGMLVLACGLIGVASASQA